MELKHFRWAALWPVLFCVSVLGRVFSPFACMFVVRSLKTDTVKRLGKAVVELPRDNLVSWLVWFSTDDNNVDEYWYGMYDKTSDKTQVYYDTHRVFRWRCRVLWLQRNSMYYFNRKYFGLAKDSKWAWQYTKFFKLWEGRWNSVNIGYKAHKGFATLMYAGRVLGLRDTAD